MAERIMLSAFSARLVSVAEGGLDHVPNIDSQDDLDRVGRTCAAKLPAILLTPISNKCLRDPQNGVHEAKFHDEIRLKLLTGSQRESECL